VQRNQWRGRQEGKQQRPGTAIAAQKAGYGLGVIRFQVVEEIPGQDDVKPVIPIKGEKALER